VAIVEKLLPVDVAPLIRVAAHLVTNIILLGVVMSLIRRQSEKQQREFEESMAVRTAENRARAAEVMGTVH
jgi:hypothetical protein